MANKRMNKLDARLPEAGASNGYRHRTIRTTIVLPEALDQNLELYALQKGVPKVEVIKHALHEHLTAEGLQPGRSPRNIEVKY